MPKEPMLVAPLWEESENVKVVSRNVKAVSRKKHAVSWTTGADAPAAATLEYDGSSSMFGAIKPRAIAGAVEGQAAGSEPAGHSP